MPASRHPEPPRAQPAQADPGHAGPPEAAALTARIKAHARALGFSLVAVLPAGPARTHGFYEHWLAQGHAGEMGYLQRHAGPKRDARELLPGARSLIVAACNYNAPTPPEPEGSLHGRVSRYAWGADYHDLLRGKLEALATFAQAAAGRESVWRAVVDSAPLMEREFAARGGLGWVGRNALLIHPQHGSWLLLGELLLDLPLAYDVLPPVPNGPSQPPPHSVMHLGDEALREFCGTCRACIDACPTGAIVADKTVDARRCLSYLTIELKGPVPVDLRPALTQWLFGCDACQDACPWNRHAPPSTEPAFGGDSAAAFPDLVALLALDDAGFRERYRQTPLWRTKRRGLLRNAALLLGNRLLGNRAIDPGTTSEEREAALSALRGALHDTEPVVRGAAAWALGQCSDAASLAALRAALAAESDETVRDEISAALGQSAQI